MKNLYQRPLAPIHIRKLKAEMVVAGLSLREAARRAGVPYTKASSILSGAMVSPKAESALRKAIRRALQGVVQ